MEREWIYGRQPVRELLKAARRRCHRLLVAQGVRGCEAVSDIERLAGRAAVPLSSPPRQELDRRCSGGNHQGVAIEVDPYPYAELDHVRQGIRGSSQPAFLLVLDHLQDPQNLGSLLRSAECMGAHGAVIAARRAAEVTPAVVRASAGAVEHLLVVKSLNLVGAIKRLKEEDGVWFAGLEVAPDSTACDRADFSGPIGLVVGNEGDGLSRPVRNQCDYTVQIPIRGHAASLNAAMAGAVAMYEVARQRTGQDSRLLA
jgi:23S rRNA (guanosine2251-2'-O)-methyltransferase